jgi:hypothetical protein
MLCETGLLFDEECLGILDQPGASRHFRNKKNAYLKAKIDEPETKSKIKNIKDVYRGINDFKPRINTVKDEKGDLVADSHSILARWRNYFFQLLIVHRVNNVWQTEIHTKESTVPASNASEVELATEQLKSHKSTDIDLIPEELIKAGYRRFALRFTNLRVLLLFAIRRNCLRGGRSRS